MRIQFFFALVLAASFSDVTDSHAYIRAWRAIKALFGWTGGKDGLVTEEAYQRRLATCRDCPVFYSRLNTCGSPMATNPKLGCWCWLPAKNRLAEAVCWMDEQEMFSKHSWLANGVE
jgi:hypothetical protein